jgi:hypothetical protein
VTTASLEPRFVDAVPAEIEPGVLYVSMEFSTTSHLCCCGCGSRVVLPLHPTAWRLTYDGKAISMSPSVGSWTFPCRSHYWIRANRIEWAGAWSDEKIAAGRRRTLIERGVVAPTTSSQPVPTALPRPRRRGVIQRVLDNLLGRTQAR